MDQQKHFHIMILNKRRNEFLQNLKMSENKCKNIKQIFNTTHM